MPSDGVPRCYEPVTDDHLRRLAQLALPVFEGLFDRRPETFGRYRGRLLMLALCQGAAQHRVDGRHGVKDLDVWGLLPTTPRRALSRPLAEDVRFRPLGARPPPRRHGLHWTPCRRARPLHRGRSRGG